MCCYNSMCTGMYPVGMNVPLKTNRANKYAHVHLCHEHECRSEDYTELMTEDKWLGSVDTAGVSHESMFADISNDNNRLFYSEFAYHLNSGSNFAQQIIDNVDNARPE